MRMGGVWPFMLRREEELPVWWVLMVKALCLGSYCDSASTSESVMAPRERTIRAVMRRAVSRKTKLWVKLVYIIVRISGE
jgi:hypothetical protein